MTGTEVRVSLDGARRILVEREPGGVVEYSLWEPLDDEGPGYAVVRLVDGEVMGRADSRRRAPPPSTYDEALEHEEQQRRRSEAQLLANCRELCQAPGKPGPGVSRSRGRMRLHGTASPARHDTHQQPHPVRRKKAANC